VKTNHLRRGIAVAGALIRPIVAVFGLLACAAIALAGHAEAHAALIGQSPAADATIVAAPADVRLTFNESVTPVRVRVLNAAGTAVTADGDVFGSDDTVGVRLPGDLPRGTYVVTWRVISADSHPVGGSFIFNVGAASPNPTAAPAEQKGPWPAIALAMRAAFYICVLTAVGGCLFLCFIDTNGARSGPDRRLIRWAGAVAIAFAALSIGVEGALALGAPLSGILDLAVWRLGLGTSVTASAGLTAAGLAIMLCFLSRGPVVAPLAGAFLAVAGFALTGHVATAEPRVVTIPALIVHVGAASYWVGAFAPLWRRIGGEPVFVAGPIVSRFAFGAVMVLACLIAAGISMASVQIQTFSALTETDYGHRFLLKQAFVVTLLGFAAFNKLRLTPGFARGVPRSAALLRKSIVLEFALTIGVLLATASLAQVSPPRAITETPHPDVRRFTAVENGLLATLTIDPGRRGENRIVVTIADKDGARLAEPSEVTIWLACPELGIEASARLLTKSADGQFVADRVPLPVAGVWVIEMDALMTEFDRTAFTVRIPVP
jgi:copper transport protein